MNLTEEPATSFVSEEISSDGPMHSNATEAGPSESPSHSEFHITKPFEGSLTLDEPLKTTIVEYSYYAMRDTMMIYNRMKKLLDIRSTTSYVHENSWDLWGPFLICLLVSR